MLPRLPLLLRTPAERRAKLAVRPLSLAFHVPRRSESSTPLPLRAPRLEPPYDSELARLGEEPLALPPLPKSSKSWLWGTLGDSMGLSVGDVSVGDVTADREVGVAPRDPNSELKGDGVAFTS